MKLSVRQENLDRALTFVARASNSKSTLPVLGNVLLATENGMLKLVATNLKGQHSWWANRGDDSDMRLSRAFDLRNVKTATLTFSTWYDIEDGWDYGYVEVSTDGGKHWQILPGKTTTDKNPVGNAFGVGWTGISGGGKTPAWVEEKVDLSAFAGKQILLRFEYVTDDALNLPGWLIDDIRIPELNYSDDAELGNGGWQAEGWALIDNVLPQRWLVQILAVRTDGTMVLERMKVGPDGRGQAKLDKVDTLDDAVMIISALAPVTTERAKYSYTVAPKAGQ